MCLLKKTILSEKCFLKKIYILSEKWQGRAYDIMIYQNAMNLRK